jgi:hypothetical protein
VGGTEIHDEPSDANAEEGTVVVDGPDGVAFTLTPNAAKETGNRLQATAEKAQDQLDGKRPMFDINGSPPSMRRKHHD